MSSFLAHILFQKTPAILTDPGVSRRIVFDEHHNLSVPIPNGTIAEQSLKYLEQAGGSAAASEIAKAINVSASRVAVHLKVLAKSGKITRVKIEGCKSEYHLV